MVYVDEAHTLTQRTLYDYLVSAFSDYATELVFLIALSTDFKMDVLAPAAQSRSARNRKAGQVPIAPFTEMPFDLILDVMYTQRERWPR
jgi:hypothetical protein